MNLNYFNKAYLTFGLVLKTRGQNACLISIHRSNPRNLEPRKFKRWTLTASDKRGMWLSINTIIRYTIYHDYAVLVLRTINILFSLDNIVTKELNDTIYKYFRLWKSKILKRQKDPIRIVFFIYIITQLVLSQCQI